MHGARGDHIPAVSANVEMLTFDLARGDPGSFVINVIPVWTAGFRDKRLPLLDSHVVIQGASLFAVNVEQNKLQSAGGYPNIGVWPSFPPSIDLRRINACVLFTVPGEWMFGR